MDRKICFQKVLEITKKQTEILERKDINEFVALLEKRQGMIDEINGLMDKSLEQEEMEIIKQIQNMDKQHKQLIEKLYSDLQDEVKKFRMQSKYVLSYETEGTLAQMGGYYFDKKER